MLGIFKEAKHDIDDINSIKIKLGLIDKAYEHGDSTANTSNHMLTTDELEYYLKILKINDKLNVSYAIDATRASGADSFADALTCWKAQDEGDSNLIKAAIVNVKHNDQYIDIAGSACDTGGGCAARGSHYMLCIRREAIDAQQFVIINTGYETNIDYMISQIRRSNFGELTISVINLNYQQIEMMFLTILNVAGG